jgi:hypothetical protein
MQRAEFGRLVAGLERHPQVAVLSDEIHGEILYDGAEHVSLLDYPALRERVILLDGMPPTLANGTALPRRARADCCQPSTMRNGKENFDPREDHFLLSRCWPARLSQYNLLFSIHE